MPDSNALETLKSLVENSRAQIGKAVRIACRQYKHHATPEESEDFTEDIIKLLLEKDCRKLRTHDPGKASFTTWLQHVVNHHVSRQLQKQHPAESLEEALFNLLSYAPQQEKELLWKERRAMLYAAVAKLSLRYQRIARLKLREVSDEEIARELNIKLASVGREWRAAQTKLKQILTDGAQSKAKQSKDMMPPESFCKIFYFGVRFLFC